MGCGEVYERETGGVIDEMFSDVVLWSPKMLISSLGPRAQTAHVTQDLLAIVRTFPTPTVPRQRWMLVWIDR